MSIRTQPVPSYFQKRRQALGRLAPGAAFIFPASPEVLRTGDTPYPYRQDSNLYYLTGFEEPESFLVMIPNGTEHRSFLFVRERNQTMEIWTGERYGPDRTEQIFGVDAAYPNTEFHKQLPSLLKSANSVYYRVGPQPLLDRKIIEHLEVVRANLGRSGRGLMPLQDPEELLGEMRLFKRPEEVEELRQVAEITSRAHIRIMKEAQVGMMEYELQAILEYEFRKSGCSGPAYSSIVGAGKNATCLHYIDNDCKIEKDQTILVDAGGERNFYNADLTRTFPSGKKFTDAQAKVYDVVLEAQKETVAKCRSGSSIRELNDFVAVKLMEGLKGLGLVKGDPKEMVEKTEHRKYFPHGVSHWLGMDVHDVGLYELDGKPRKFEPGMVLTVEPGIYFQPGDESVPPEFRNMGIRIEDDVLVTSDQPEVFTKTAPKERAEIEALRSG